MNQNVPMVSQPGSGLAAMAKFHQLKEQLKKMAADKKGVKTNHDQIQDQAVDKLLNINKRYVEVGKGQYAELTKVKMESGLGKDKHEEFFNELFEQISQKRIKTSDMDNFTRDCTNFLALYLSRFEKRKLKIEFKKQVRRKTCDDLKTWLDSAPIKD